MIQVRIATTIVLISALIFGPLGIAVISLPKGYDIILGIVHFVIKSVLIVGSAGYAWSNAKTVNNAIKLGKLRIEGASFANGCSDSLTRINIDNANF